MLESFGSCELRGELRFQLGVALAVATLPRMKGQKGCVLSEAWWGMEGIEVFHSIWMMLRRPHKEVAERNQGSYWYEEVRPKV